MGSINIFKPLSTFLEPAAMIILSSSDKKIGKVGNRTWGCWMRSKYATYVLCSPTAMLNIYQVLLLLSLHRSHIRTVTSIWAAPIVKLILKYKRKRMTNSYHRGLNKQEFKISLVWLDQSISILTLRLFRSYILGSVAKYFWLFLTFPEWDNTEQL